MDLMPSCLNDFEYRVKLPKAEDIMTAQSGEAVDGYKFNNINLKYETIEGANFDMITPPYSKH